MNELKEMLLEMSAELRLLRAEVVSLQVTVENSKIRQQYFGMREACEFMRISRTKMQQMLSAGELPWAVRKGKKWMFPVSKMNEYMSNIEKT